MKLDRYDLARGMNTRSEDFQEGTSIIREQQFISHNVQMEHLSALFCYLPLHKKILERYGGRELCVSLHLTFPNP
jgi:hypothetical protein